MQEGAAVYTVKNSRNWLTANFNRSDSRCGYLTKSVFDFLKTKLLNYYCPILVLLKIRWLKMEMKYYFDQNILIRTYENLRNEYCIINSSNREFRGNLLY